MQTPYIYDALRTPRGKGKAPKDGKPGGTLAEIPAHQLVCQLIDGLQHRNSDFIDDVRSLTLGCVGQIGTQGGHIALVSRLASSLPNTVVAKSINNFCVSGLTAINEAATAVAAGQSGLFLAGGVESLSQVGFLADKASYYRDPALMQSLPWAPPIMGAELIATLNGIEKQDLDEITLRSHKNAAEAWANGRYNSAVMPVADESGNVLLAQDELIRADLDINTLSEMQPAFADQGAQGFDALMLAAYPELKEINHVHSFANCPGMADGAALALVGDKESGSKLGLHPKARIRAMRETASDPILQLTAGFDAINHLLADTGLTITDFDRIEFMEAFAAVPVKFMRDFDVSPDKVNVNGGHLAMGHPMGATGAILLTNLVHELERCDGQLGLVVAQAGSGVGSAMIIERG